MISVSWGLLGVSVLPSIPVTPPITTCHSSRLPAPPYILGEWHRLVLEASLRVPADSSAVYSITLECDELKYKAFQI